MRSRDVPTSQKTSTERGKYFKTFKLSLILRDEKKHLPNRVLEKLTSLGEF